MEITITKKQASMIGFASFEPFGLKEQSWHWRGNSKVEIRLDALASANTLGEFEKLLSANDDVWGVKPMLKHIKMYRDAVVDNGTGKMRDLVQFATALKAFLSKVPDHRVHRVVEGRWFAYHATNIRYHKQEIYSTAFGRRIQPAHVTMALEFATDSGNGSTAYTWWIANVKGYSVAQILTNSDIFIDTEELRAAYDRQTARFQKMYRALGKQYVLNGHGQNLEKVSDNWWERHKVVVNKYADARVVVDLRDEGEEDEEETSTNDESISSFWMTEKQNEETGKTESVGEAIIRPIHPYLTVYHLSRHLRLRVHSEDLKKYKYDRKLIHKLVIDDKRKQLVKMLIEHHNSKFRDVVAGKAGGAIVMLCGAPGTGKTLTAEVFAESEKRALYSVQCSQLGTDATELEASLLKVLARAARWKAVLLLDEADVYIQRRDTDIVRNALVGVFLRVLEYQNAVLFLTTNRANDIDDAVASRCTAKLTYERPSAEELTKIWKVLSATAGVDISDKTIAAVVKAHPDLSGRDVKNLLKLAVLTTKRKKEITADTIAYVKQFKPV